jgi:hypothetical protein
VLDAALMRHATINCHPLVNTMTTSIARDDLTKFLQATGHPPRIMAVAGAAGWPRELTERIANTPLTPSNRADIQLGGLGFSGSRSRDRRPQAV